MALVYGALGCMTISGYREDTVAVVFMLEFNRAEQNTVRLPTGASGRTTPVEENASNKTLNHMDST